MKTPAYLATLQKRYALSQRERRALIHDATEAQNQSKRAIFALHRADRAGADALLSQARDRLTSVEKRVRRYPELDQEGTHVAALEEYAEAALYLQYLDGQTFRKVEGFDLDPHVYLAALSDTTGEIVRHAVREATQGNFNEVSRAHQTVEMAVGFLLNVDLTGYLRQKFDQAKRNLRSLEDILYEISIKRPPHL